MATAAFRPSVPEERWLALLARHPTLARADGMSLRTGGWRCSRLLSRCAFFGLGVLTAAMLALIFFLSGPKGAFLLAGLASLGAAEWLITQRRLFASGFEEALAVCGAMLIVFQFTDWYGGSHEAAVYAAAGTVLLLLGLRLLNPLFTTLAVAAFAASIKQYSGSEAMTVGAACLTLAALALAGGAWRFARPSFDRMLDWLVVGMPALGYFWLFSDRGRVLSAQSLQSPGHWSWPVALALSGFGLTALIVGIRRRRHAPLLAFLICALCLAYELHGLSGMPLQWRLILEGGVVLTVSVALDRWLRRPRRGVTSENLGRPNNALNVVQMAGASSLAPAAPADAGPGIQGGGGRFGGGGADGKY